MESGKPDAVEDAGRGRTRARVTGAVDEGAGGVDARSACQTAVPASLRADGAEGGRGGERPTAVRKVPDAAQEPRLHRPPR
eukprot:11349999-Alexandrium_andersonii.AAC.1